MDTSALMAGAFYLSAAVPWDRCPTVEVRLAAPDRFSGRQKDPPLPERSAAVSAAFKQFILIMYQDVGPQHKIFNKMQKGRPRKLRQLWNVLYCLLTRVAT
jgi:hypothetical protein